VADLVVDLAFLALVVDLVVDLAFLALVVDLALVVHLVFVFDLKDQVELAFVVVLVAYSFVDLIKLITLFILPC
jgi:hypothetical protein